MRDDELICQLAARIAECEDDEPAERRTRSRFTGVALNCLMVAVIFAGLAVYQRANAVFATEATLQLFLTRQIAEMALQYGLQKYHWEWRETWTAANITRNLLVIYQDLAKRHSYGEMGFGWEPKNRDYGVVRDLLDLAEGRVDPSRAREIMEENASITYYDMRSDQKIKTLVPKDEPGAALEYAAIATLAKSHAKSGQVYKEFDKHRRTVEAIRNIANVVWDGPENSTRISKILDFYESLVQTNAAELQTIEASHKGVAEQARTFRARLVMAAARQGRYEAETSMNQAERILPYQRLVAPGPGDTGQ